MYNPKKAAGKINRATVSAEVCWNLATRHNHTTRPDMRMENKGGQEEQQEEDGRSDEEDQQGGPAHLEVLVQEVEEQQDGDQEGQGKGLSQKHA